MIPQTRSYLNKVVGHKYRASRWFKQLYSYTHKIRWNLTRVHYINKISKIKSWVKSYSPITFIIYLYLNVLNIIGLLILEIRFLKYFSDDLHMTIIYLFTLDAFQYRAASEQY